ncbi:MAG TPA: hypothetical protein H9675_02230 [Firmicutes bacterium]|nr:hypothetical protein [Bacillota bacterium]
MINENAVSEKTKLGISIALLAAGMFFLGIVSYLALVAVAIYIFIREDSVWLKKAAVFAVILVVFFAAVNFALDAISGIISMVNVNINFIENIVPLIGKVFSIINYLVNIAEFVLLIVFGFMALGGKVLNIGFINKLCSKHMN